MPHVIIAKNWDWPDLLRQTPGGTGSWEDFTFSLRPEGRCDYLVILNRPSGTIQIECPPENVWAIIQEPPTLHFQSWQKGPSPARRVYTLDPTRTGKRYRHEQPALP